MYVYSCLCGGACVCVNVYVLMCVCKDTCVDPRFTSSVVLHLFLNYPTEENLLVEYNCSIYPVSTL